MSRIHEALKKAAQERSAQLAAGVEAPVAEVTSELRRPITVEPESARSIPSPLVITGGSQDGPFRYEELVKRCIRPEWRLDPRNSVFLNSKTGESGPERFRTLRSRLYQWPPRAS